MAAQSALTCRMGAKLEPQGAVRRLDALAAVRQKPGQFDLVLIDPPYRLGLAYLGDLLEEIAGQGVVAPGALLVFSRSTKSHMPVIPVNLRLARRLSYGDSIVLVYQAH